MQNIILSYFIILFISPSFCVADQSPEICGRGDFKLSLFVRRREDMKWNTSYHLDSSSCNATDNWKLIIQQNVTDIGGMRHIHMRGFFTENVNMTSGYIPTHVVVTDISQRSLSKDHSYGDLGIKCKGENITEALELQIISRKGWRARRPRRGIGAWVEPVDRIFVDYTDTLCLNNRICKLAMLKEQDDHFPSHGDIPYNFYSGEDGFVYEGLGWERRIGGNFSLIYFLDGENAPSPQQLQSFCLLIAQGIKLGKISPNFVIVGDSRVSVESNKWFNAIQDQELQIVSRQEWNARQPTEEIPVWDKPLVKVYISFNESPCFNISMCKLALMKSQNTDIPYDGDIVYNFYSGGDGLVYEGRGWDRRYDDCFNLVYYIDEDKPPSPQQLHSFGLLIAQAIKMEKISPNFTVEGAKRVTEISKKWFSVMKYA